MTSLATNDMENVRAVIAKLDGLHFEMTASVKRKADGPVSGFQLKLINSVLAEANALLKGGFPVSGFSEFDPDEIPTAGDVSMVVGQYVETFERIRCENIQSYGSSRWMWSDGSGTFTVAPRARK